MRLTLPRFFSVADGRVGNEVGKKRSTLYLLYTSYTFAGMSRPLRIEYEGAVGGLEGKVLPLTPSPQSLQLWLQQPCRLYRPHGALSVLELWPLDSHL